MNHFDNIFWTVPERKDNPPDPLGLDAMREELSNKLVPCLTGRTVSVTDAFWTLVLLRWSSVYLESESVTVKRFLEWERCLKLVWAKFPEVHHVSFDGIEQAEIQADEQGAPKRRYQRLLLNPRAQGLLGVHLRPFQKIGVVKQGTVELTDLALKWTQGVKDHPKLTDGRWNQ